MSLQIIQSFNLYIPSLAMSAACRGKQTQCRLPTKRSFVSSPLSHEKRQPFRIVFFGADNRTCSERSERNSISEQVYLQSVAPAAQRAGAHGVCRQCTALSQVLLQTKDMKKRTEIIRFVFVSFGADNRTCSERSECNSASKAILLPSGASAACRGKQTQCRLPTKRSFVSNPLPHEKRQPFRIVFFWCGQQDLNLHSLATIRT